MKYIVLLLLSMSTLQAQQITEKIETYTKKHHNIFTQAGARLDMELVKEYDIKQETVSVFKFLITISTYDTETVSTTSSGFFTAGIYGGALSATYQTNDYGGYAVLSPDDMEELFTCANSVFSYINSRKSITGINPSIASCSTNGITLSGEFTGTTTWYYFHAGDATFRMAQDQFIEVVTLLKKSIQHVDNH